jgi:uncharacterized protein (DUF427 family)
MPRVLFNGTVLVESDHTVVVEGNHYFPPEAISWDHFQKSSTKTVCPWKGLASYHDVVTDGTVHRDVGWYYPRPTPSARRIRGHIGFDRRVRIEPTDHDTPRPRLLDRLRRREATPQA